MGKATEPHVGTRTTGKPVRGDRGVCPTRCIYTRAASTTVPHHGVQRSPLPSLFGGGAFGKIWRETEVRAQHFPLSVFLLEEFFSPTADDFTILGGGGGCGDSGFCSPYTPSAGQSPTFQKKPELQSFLKMRWRGVSSLPSSNSPSPSLQPSARPGRPRQAGRRPQAHSSPHCHTAEIKDTSLSWVPASRFKSESGGGGSEPQLHATCKGGLEPICPQPPGQRPGVRHWGGGCHITHTHQAPSCPPGVSKSPSEPQTLAVAITNPHL